MDFEGNWKHARTENVEILLVVRKDVGKLSGKVFL